VPRSLPAELRELESTGRIRDAELWIGNSLAGGKLDDDASAALIVERERLRRLRMDYRLTPQQVLEKIREQIPDVTRKDLEQWREQGKIQWLSIDGNVCYFRREPSNLMRFSTEARERKEAAESGSDEKSTGSLAAGSDAATTQSLGPAGDPAARATTSFTLERHIAECLKKARETGEDVVLPVEIKIRHTVTVKPGAVPPGETIRCWIPYPCDYRQQTVKGDLITTPSKHRISKAENPQRIIYMEQPAGEEGQPTTFTAQYTYSCAAYVPDIDPEKVLSTDTKSTTLARYLGEQPPHITFSPELKALAESIVGDETNPYRKAEKIFRWMDKEIRYASEMTYSVMPSVLEKILSERKGDCGVQVIMFIGLCRVSGVPARWQSGWVTRPGHQNMHDWSEFYVEPYGWLPADPSMGLRKSDDPPVRDFLFGHMDAYRLIANMDFGGHFDPPEKHWRSDPVDSQIGEVQWEGGNLFYDQWDWDVTIE
jgi:transglutaminase-like putative cysteine protease